LNGVLLLLHDHSADNGAERIHVLFLNIGTGGRSGGGCAGGFAQPDDAVKLGEFLLSGAADGIDIGLGQISRADTGIEGVELYGQDGRGLAIGDEAIFDAGEEISALSGFGIFKIGQDGVEGFDGGVNVKDSAVEIDRPLIDPEGDGSGDDEEDRHGDEEIAHAETATRPGERGGFGKMDNIGALPGHEIIVALCLRSRRPPLRAGIIWLTFRGHALQKVKFAGKCRQAVT